MEGRNKSNFDFHWKFNLGDNKEAKNVSFDDSSWKHVNIPHDWSIEGVYSKDSASGRRGGYLPVGIGWYRKKFNIEEPFDNKKVFIEFDGVYMNSEVWINGHHLGKRPYGYIGFEYDITEYLNKEDNVIAVRVDTSKAPSDRWYTGAGIYRHVWITITNEIFVGHWGTYITTREIKDDLAKVKILFRLNNKSNEMRNITVTTYINNHKGVTVAANTKKESIISNGYIEKVYYLDVKKPKLWSPDSPYLYINKIVVKEKNKVIDEVKTVFGIRSFNFDSETGFELNGESLKFKGVCLHQDAGPVGVAVPEKVLERRLNILKKMGCNAIRTAHNPMAPEFYDMCDKIGFMVIDEAFDGWEMPKVEYDYSVYFNEWWEKDLYDFLLRDRNHACVILWSIGNEVRDMKLETTKKLVDFVHLHEPTRPVTCGVNLADTRADENRKLLDVAGYNGGGGACFLFEEDHEKYPDRKFIATEIPHTLHTRGFYRTQTWWRDKNKKRIEIKNLTPNEIFFDGAIQYCSSYDNCGVRISAIDSWKQTKKLSYLSGEFRWTGFDYLGESSGWPARMGNGGVIDLCGFPKDHYYFYQSQWSNEPMIHILPHWTHSNMEDTIIPVWVYTNCESVELYLNDNLLSCQDVGEKMYTSWDVPYKPGTLRAIGKINGKKKTESVIKTAGFPEKIKLTTDNHDLKPNCRDISHVTFEITDRDNNLVPYANNKVVFYISGSVTNLGMENGDPIDLTPNKINYRKAFYGKGIGIFQSTFGKGNIEIIAGGILGNEIFRKTTKVAISVSHIMLRGENIKEDFLIYYTLDGTEPNEFSSKYREPFTISESCKVRCKIVYRNKQILSLETYFKKGVREKVIDTYHGND